METHTIEGGCCTLNEHQQVVVQTQERSLGQKLDGLMGLLQDAQAQVDAAVVQRDQGLLVIADVNQQLSEGQVLGTVQSRAWRRRLRSQVNLSFLQVGRG